MTQPLIMIGNIPIYTYPLLISLSLGIGFIRALWQLPRQEIVPVIAAGIWALSLGLLTARAGYLAVHWAYFSNHPGEILLFPLGGLTWVGMVIGCGVALGVYCAVEKRPGCKAVDTLVVPGGLLAAAGCLGCWVEGCAYGGSSPTWLSLAAPDEWGILAPRVPLQLLGMGIILALTAFLDLTSWQGLRIPGMRMGVFYSGLVFTLTGMSFLRQDPAPTWNGLRLESWFGMGISALTLLAVLGLQLSVHRGTRRQGLENKDAPPPHSTIIDEEKDK